MTKSRFTRMVVSAALTGTLIFGLAACGDANSDKAEATTAAATTEATTAATTEATTTATTEATTAATEAATEATTAATTETTTAATTEATTAATTEATTAATEATTEATTAAASSNVDYNGTYAESHAGRGVITVTAEGDCYCVEINWSGSASEKARWLFHGNFDANGYMSYTDCYKQHYVYDESGEATITEEYTNGSGSIQCTNGSITWADAQEDVANGCGFVKQ